MRQEINVKNMRVPVIIDVVCDICKKEAILLEHDEYLSSLKDKSNGNLYLDAKVLCKELPSCGIRTNTYEFRRK